MALVFDQTDQADIDTANAAGGEIWKNDCLDRLKQKIKDHYLQNDTCQCCYCARLFIGEFRMVIDIEHVLPQSKYDSERFAPLNLNIACKRCNMNIKKADTSFLTDTAAMGTDYYHSHHYKIIHPNLDIYTDHITFTELRRGNWVYIKYVIKNQHKAQFTYTYFKLKELEIDNINRAQGATVSQGLSARISEGIRQSLANLLSRI